MPEKKKKKPVAKKTTKKGVKSTAKKPLKKKKITTKQAPVHPLRERFELLIKNTSKYALIYLSAFIGILVVFTVFFHLFTKTDFEEYIPKDTSKFLSVKLSEQTLEVLPHAGFFIASGLQEQHLQKAVEAKVPYITFLENDRRESSFFLENVSKKNVRMFLESFSTAQEVLEAREENDSKIYSLTSGQEIHCAYESRVLFCGKKKAYLNAFIEKQFMPVDELKGLLQKVPSAPLTWYADATALTSPLMQAQKEVVEKIVVASKLRDGKMINNIYVQTNQEFTSQENKKLKKNALARYFPAETLFFLGGQSFEKQWIDTEEFYKQKTPEYALILKGILQAKVKNIFGADVNFYEDILPLFQGMYAFGVTQNEDESMQLSFVAEQKDRAGVESLLDAFFANRGVFTVEKKELKVSEKLTLAAIYSNEDKVEKVEERKGVAKITGYEIEGQEWGIFVAQKGTLVFVSTSQESLENLLSRKESSLLKQMPNTLKGSYEFGHLSLENLNTLLSFSPFGVPQLDALSFIKNISWESKSFPGAISIVVESELSD